MFFVKLRKGFSPRFRRFGFRDTNLRQRIGICSRAVRLIIGGWVAGLGRNARAVEGQYRLSRVRLCCRGRIRWLGSFGAKWTSKRQMGRFGLQTDSRISFWWSTSVKSSTASAKRPTRVLLDRLRRASDSPGLAYRTLLLRAALVFATVRSW